MEATTLQDWAIEHYFPKADGGQVLVGTDVYRTDAQTVEGILGIERRCWGDRVRLRLAEPQDFDGKRNPFAHIKILPPDCKNWVLIGMVDGEIISKRTYRDTTLEDFIKLASESANGYESIDLRPAFPDDIAKDLSSEDWAGAWKIYEAAARSELDAPGIGSLVILVGLALLVFFVPQWRLYAGPILGLAAIRLIYKVGVAAGARQGFSHGVGTGVPLGIEKLAADLDEREPQWRWREIIASVGKPGQSD